MCGTTRQDVLHPGKSCTCTVTMITRVSKWRLLRLTTQPDIDISSCKGRHVPWNSCNCTCQLLPLDVQPQLVNLKACTLLLSLLCSLLGSQGDRVSMKRFRFAAHFELQQEPAPGY